MSTQNLKQQNAMTQIKNSPGGVRKLSLSNFRSYSKVELELGEGPVIIVGRNGAGKTNLVEALSLLSSGRGLRSAKLPQLLNQNATAQHHANSWAISCQLQDNAGDEFHIGTALTKTSTGTDKRIIRINQDSIKNQFELVEWLSVVWMTPYMDQVFTEGASAKRRFIDRLVQAVYPEHASQVYRYEHLLRERMHLLRSSRPSDVWLTALEAKIAAAGIAVSSIRQQFAVQLQSMQLTDTPFPQFLAHMQGKLEQWLQEMPALLAEERFQAALGQSRSTDAENQSTAYGAHRSNLVVKHKNKQCYAELCSTGEQKMLLLAMILAFVRLQMSQTDVARPHLLLLDDAVTHLDEQHRAVLFDEIKALKAQVWLTGAQEADFTGMEAAAQWITIDQGIITQH